MNFYKAASRRRLQRLEDRLEDFTFPSLSASLYHAHNVQLTAILEDMVDFFAYRCILDNYATSR